MSERSASNSHERGQSLLEFAFGTVLLLVMIAGLVDASRALFTYMALRDAAQEGAIFGSMNAEISNPAVRYQIINRICKASNMFQGVSCNDITVNPAATIKAQLTAIGPACAGNGINVKLRYDNFPLTMPFIGAILGRQTVSISTSVTDTILQPIACP